MAPRSYTCRHRDRERAAGGAVSQGNQVARAQQAADARHAHVASGGEYGVHEWSQREGAHLRCSEPRGKWTASGGQQVAPRGALRQVGASGWPAAAAAELPCSKPRPLARFLEDSRAPLVARTGAGPPREANPLSKETCSCAGPQGTPCCTQQRAHTLQGPADCCKFAVQARERCRCRSARRAQAQAAASNARASLVQSTASGPQG